MKRLYLILALACLTVLWNVTALAQTNPAAQTLPYSQDFSGLAHSSTTYPTGWQGWQLSISGAIGSFRTNAPTADLVLIASSGASSTTGGIHNYNGKIGILQTNGSDPSIALAINTTGSTNIQVAYDAMTIRNPHDGGSNTRINEMTLQYRVGTSGSFTSLTGIEYQNNTTTQTGSGVTTPQNLQSKNITLPLACNNQSVVQLRWAARDVSGAGSRASFAVDNIGITSTGPFFRSAASGDWNVNSTWEQSFDGSLWVAATSTPTSSTANTITIRNGHTVTVTANVSADQVIVESTGQISVDSSITLTIDDATGTDLTNGGTVLVNGILTLNGDITSAGTLSASTGTVNYFKSTSGQNVIAANYFLLAFNNQNKILPAGTIGILDTFTTGSATGHTITGNTIDFQKATSQTVPVFNYNNLANTGNGQRTFSSGTIGVAGTFHPGTGGSHTVTGNTIEYNGSSAQDLISPARGFTYNNLSINNAAGVTALDTSGSTVTISSTLFLKAGAFTLNTGNGVEMANGSTIDRSAGSISAAPVFNTSVNVIYSGASAVNTGPELPTSTTVLNNLTINKSGGVTLTASAQANGTLALSSGLVTTGVNILTLSGSATYTGGSSSSYIDGYIRKIYSNTNAFVFPVGNAGYAPVTIDPAVTSNLGDVTAKTVRDFHPKILTTATALQRYWTLVNNGITLADLTFQWLAGEAQGMEANYWAFKIEGGTTTQHFATINTMNHTGTVLAQTSFSDWTFAELNTPTAVRLARFNAASFADGVQLNWDTGFEVNNLGYHLYREENGQRTRVTPSVIAGSALIVGAGRRLTAGYSYSWFDPEGTPNSSYSLEAIDLDGSSEWAGPIYPYSGRDGQTRKAPKSAREQAMLLTDLVSEGRDSKSVRSWPAAIDDATASNSSITNSSELEGKTGQSVARTPQSKAGLNAEAGQPSVTTQQSIAAGNAVKIQVRKSGWYRVTQGELVAAGFDPSSDARTLQLYADGEEVPISLSTEGARLGTRDIMEFYGIPLETPTSDTRTYWLVSGSTPGKRMIARRGKLKPADQNSGMVSGSFDLTIERREKLIYFSSLTNGDTENFFGSPVSSQPVNQSLTLRNIDRDSVSQPQLEVALQGVTAGNHQVQLQINGVNLGAMTFVDREHGVAKFAVNLNLLREGENVVSVVRPGGATDVTLLDWVRLTYPHQYKAENNSLTFSAMGGNPVEVGGFNTQNVRVVDVTDPNSPTQLSAYAASSGGTYAVNVQPASTGVRTLIAFTEDQMVHPISISANQPSSWSAVTNSADMVIITHKNFRQAIEPLASLRRSQGLSVSVVDVEDVYDEFSYGAHSPAAIKSFMTTAAAKWSRKPKYLLLVGDSTWDPRNYLNKGDHDFVPTKLIDTNGMETGSDDWLADFDGLGLANLAVGRLPASTVAEVNLMVSKIISYEQERELNAPLRGAVMVADRGFETQSSQTRALLPANLTVQIINRAEVGNDDMMRGQIVNALNQGPTMVNYYGHGAVKVWTGEGLLSSDLAGALTNSNRLSVFVMMTCLNGYASDASNVDSLAEAALKAPNGGAVAVWASSGFTSPDGQFEMNSEFYRLLFGGQPMRLGDAARNAKAATSDLDVRRTWILLGDPAMRVR